MTRLSTILAIVVTLLAGIVAGLALTTHLLASSRPPGAARFGAWVTWPTTGGNAYDPYSRAFFARRGDIAMNSVEGLAFFAQQDSDGRDLVSSRLDDRCSYAISGIFPAARHWTIHVYNLDGSPISHALGRSGFTSSDAVLDSGLTRIILSIDPQAGNWIPLPKDQRFIVVLRFYDTPLSAAISIIDADRLPRLTQTMCAA